MNFEELAARYDAWYQTPLGALAHALERKAIFSLAEIKNGDRVLDVGCGTGIYTLEMAQRVAQVIGVDPSEAMLLIARKKLKRAGCRGRFIRASAEALPFRPGVFDLALSVTSLCFVPRPDKAIHEAHRVLKSDGRLVLGELNRWSLWAFLRRLKGLFKDTVYKQAHFWSRGELEELLQRNGFKPVTSQVLLYFPPINLRWFLKSYCIFEGTLKKVLPASGAFIAVKAVRARINCV